MHGWRRKTETLDKYCQLTHHPGIEYISWLMSNTIWCIFFFFSMYIELWSIICHAVKQIYYFIFPKDLTWICMKNHLCVWRHGSTQTSCVPEMNVLGAKYANSHSHSENNDKRLCKDACWICINHYSQWKQNQSQMIFESLKCCFPFMKCTNVTLSLQDEWLCWNPLCPRPSTSHPLSASPPPTPSRWS